MIGILCEKPSAAQHFAKALGGRNGNYSGETYLIVASHGHLFEFAQPEAQVPPALAEKYKSWELGNLPWNEKEFAWKRVLKSGAGATLKNIKMQLSKCDEITIATDADPSGEGELLAWEILDELKLHPKKWSRMYFIDESVKEVRKAFSERKPIASMQTDMDYVKADFRSKFDYLSMQFTRIATKQGDGHSVLRQGRLKSAMVLIVGDQLKKLGEYQKIPFYQNRFKDENGVVYTDPEEPQFPKKEQVPQKYHASAVVCDSKELKSSSPPAFLDLAALAARLSSKGFKAKTVLDVYQKMYEDEIVSYPRTEDKVISPEQFNELLPLIDKIAGVVGVDAALLTHRTPRKTHVKAGGSHGANRPGVNVPGSLEAVESEYGKIGALIYEALAKNYLASLAEDYEYEAQKGHVADHPAFIGKVNVPKKQGWKAVFSEDRDDEESEEASDKGLGTKASPFVYEGFPPKPATPTMKWLTEQLEKYDVGTGATRTSIYADVTNEDARYPLLKDTRGRITMTEYGDMSYRLLPNTHIGSLKITEDLQADMRGIVAGTVDPIARLACMQQMVMDDVKAMTANGAAMRAALGKAYSTEGEIIGLCPRCGSKIIEGKNGFGCSGYKSGCKFVIWKVQKGGMLNGVRISREQASELLKGETVTLSGLVSARTGTKYSAAAVLDDPGNDTEYMGTNIKVQFDDSPVGRCPICGGDVVEGNKVYRCKSEDCKFMLSKALKGAKISREEAETLLQGKQSKPHTFTWSSGNKSKASIKLKLDGSIEFIFADAKSAHRGKSTTKAAQRNSQPQTAQPGAWRKSRFN